MAIENRQVNDSLLPIQFLGWYLYQQVSPLIQVSNKKLGCFCPSLINLDVGILSNKINTFGKVPFISLNLVIILCYTKWTPFIKLEH